MSLSQEMDFKIHINNIRRRLMNRITKHIGGSYSEPKIKPGEKIEIQKILIIRPNHRLGNQLLLTPLVQEVINTFPNCKIDLFVKGGVAHPVFENYQNINKIIQLPRKPFSNLFTYTKGWISIKSKKYDLVINGDKNSSSGRLLTQISNATFKVFGDVDESIQKQYSDHKHISKSPVYMPGKAAETIEITSSDNSGNGFSIIQTQGKSQLSYVNFSNFNTLNYKGWELSGSVTFYEADVLIENCKFSNRTSLNMVLLRTKLSSL